ncbi:yfcB protein [endosymbiont of Sipalinus gigas]|uniref:50S ribosomal protein L3 N(5)-glutamine methyltransferase n=1 Tax=endosymbiont of Sipalinus gigas TaxID=1972134 RepID=UPI000DC7309C|nr:50S ribosomal protein L3 N(5)-glutamine methyltransferase [endosymbiont of Sipalinus gigas]BBA85311.1 yfcB protein [endosymbiont of Sipalinus gigas]
MNNIQNDIYKIDNLYNLIIWAKKISKNNNIKSPGFNNLFEEIKFLIFYILDVPFYYYKYLYNLKIENSKKEILINIIKKRIYNKKPIFYLINRSIYYELLFFIDKNTIIPRSPIGGIIKNKYIKKIIKNPKLILDLCTGSGCLAILLAFIYKKSKIDASDISQKSLLISKKNIIYYKMDNRINLIRSNLFNKILNKYDLIVSNPPYLNYIDIINLPKEYKNEPIKGLYGGKNGLKFIEKIINSSLNYLNKNGILICEIGNNYKLLKKKYPNLKFNWIKTNKNNKIFFLKKV